MVDEVESARAQCNALLKELNQRILELLDSAQPVQTLQSNL